MKKIILIAIVAVAVTVACRKERTCDCTITNTAVSSAGTATTSKTVKTTIDKQKKKEFREINQCYDYTAVQTKSVGTATNMVTYTDDYKCEVK